MSANYPSSVKIWSPADAAFRYPEDLTTIVYARHVTQLYEEVTAVQSELGAGAGGLKSAITYDVAPYDPSSPKVWPNLKARLANIEQGVYDAATRRVSTLGGSTVVPSGTSVVGVAIKAAIGQSANLLEFRTSNNALANRFGSDGLIAGVIDGGNA